MATTSDSLFPELEPRATLEHSTGLLPEQFIREFIDAGHITGDEPIEDGQIQPASLDLRLGAVAYRVRASFLPGADMTVGQRIEHLGMHEIDLAQGAVLERDCVYIIPLMERLSLPAHYSASASPKSSTGRLDVFTRLIVDHGTAFENVPERYRGGLYVEVSPRTFSVLVRQGVRLNQLRLRRGVPPPADAALERLHRREPLVFAEEAPAEARIAKGLWISIDLEGRSDSRPIGFRAKKHAALIDVAKVAHYDPLDFWEPIVGQGDGHLILDPDAFYILTSKEKVSVPLDHAAQMVPYDPSVGEYRVHYAGFFDPGFGYGAEAATGTSAVLEVRSHEVPFLLEDGQVVGRLVYERLLAPAQRAYGTAIGSAYQRQGLTLSKPFKPFSDR
ncbi:MAG: 2'-deoxycytidine 5'-triphosphate deaminase [Proteobacteria bacterium]|nr:2'-deoxycytidine 5'-triphosphate deaminase [Pseudomonadota bacterium]